MLLYRGQYQRAAHSSRVGNDCLVIEPVDGVDVGVQRGAGYLAQGPAEKCRAKVRDVIGGSRVEGDPEYTDQRYFPARFLQRFPQGGLRLCKAGLLGVLR